MATPAGDMPSNWPLVASPHHKRDAGDACNDAASTPTDGHDEHTNAAAFLHNAQFAHTVAGAQEEASHPKKPSDAGLSLQTHLSAPRDTPAFQVPQPAETEAQLPATAATSRPAIATRRSFEMRKSFETNSSVRSPSSTASSPGLAPLGDITPLPSPIGPTPPRDQWNSHGRPHSGSTSSLSREDTTILPPAAFTSSPQRMKKSYPNHLSLQPTSAPQDDGDASGHIHNRSISEYTPDPLTNPRPRNVTNPSVATRAAANHSSKPSESHMHREEYLAKQRKMLGAADPARTLPSPPPSNRSAADSDEGDDGQTRLQEQFGHLAIHDSTTRKLRHWRPLKRLGQGAFSQVILATSAEDYPVANPPLTPADCVAIKIVARDPISGPNEERMETSIRREIEILQCVSHPCLPHLSAFDESENCALLVLNYCPGGDLFDLASQHREMLTPALIQRVFAEIVAAVRYLHSKYIVHRDIKLENVLFNCVNSKLPRGYDMASTYPFSLTTLTDLGLSKRIPEPPESPMLTHACGSADYAAPELLLGQPYDGRATDAWALGVLLYALLEGRLPFDPPPRGRGKRWSADMRSVKHRIARCDWLWSERGDDSGDWDPSRGEGLDGAKDVVEGLLKKVSRGRWALDKVAASPWVQAGIRVDGGLRSPVEAGSAASALCGM